MGRGPVPAGETIVDIPVINREPIPGIGQDKPTRMLELLPVAPRSAPVYSILRQDTIADSGRAGVVKAGDL